MTEHVGQLASRRRPINLVALSSDRQLVVGAPEADDVLPHEAWDTVIDAVDEKCRAEDAERRGVEDQRPIGHKDISHFGGYRINAFDALLQHLTGAEDGTMTLHGPLHAVADLSGRLATPGIAEDVEP